MAIGDFTDQADAYRRARPNYPRDLVAELAASAGIRRGASVADVGAGTGIMTRLLNDLGFKVTAVEPNAAMWGMADLPEIPHTDGSMEATELSDQSQDWIVIAQAFHWADPGRALPELRRVLRRDGTLTVIWNDRVNHADEVLTWTEAAIKRHVPEFQEAYRDHPWGDVLASTGDFVVYDARASRHLVPMSVERYLDLWRSHNRLNNVAGAERFQAFLADLTSHLDDHNIERIDVPYDCSVWSARRID